MTADVIATFKHEKPKRIRHYEIQKKDWIKLKAGEPIFFYEGKEIDIHFKLHKDVLKEVE